MANDNPNDNPNEDVETTNRPRREVKKPDKWSYDPEEHKTMLDRKRKSLVSFMSCFADSWLYGIFLEKEEEGRNRQGQKP